MINRLLSRLGIEVWKDIPEFEGLYQVSNLGNIKSLNYRGQSTKKVLKKYINSGSGRRSVSLSKKGKVYLNQCVYVLVAEAFLNHKRCGYKKVVDHIDNNPLNDYLYNLQLLTHRENISKNAKNKVGYTGVQKARKKYTSKIYINNKQIYLGTFETAEEASQAYQKELKKIL